MDRSTAEVALLSIHPRFAEAILQGAKKVEFRRTRFAKNVSHVVIYATQPIGKVVGWFEVAGIESDHPDALWELFRSCGAIEEADFRAYYAGSETGHAIQVRSTRRLTKPKSLNSLIGSSLPPQSFCYLDKKTSRRLFAAPSKSIE